MSARQHFGTVGLSFVLLSLSACQQGTGSTSSTQTAADSAPAIPSFVRADGWGTLPNGWIFGSVSGVAVDADDNVWILHRPRSVPEDQAAMAAPSVVVFDKNGGFVKAWGGPAADRDWPQSEHGIHVDHEGFVWVTGNYCAGIGTPRLDPVDDDQILKLTQDGDLVLQIGKASQSGGNADTENFHRPAAAVVHPASNEVFVADGYGNHRVIVMDADDGSFRRMWGAFGSEPLDDNRCGTQFLGPDAPPWNEEQFSIVHGIGVANDGQIYVADREHGRLQVFGLDGEYTTQVDEGRGANFMNVAFSADAEQRYVYVWGVGGVRVFDRRTLDLLTTIADAPGATGPGHLIATDSEGNLYLARLGGGIEKLVFDGLTAQ